MEKSFLRMRSVEYKNSDGLEDQLLEDELPRKKQTKFRKFASCISISTLILTVVCGSILIYTYYLSTQKNTSLDAIMSFENWKIRFSKTYLSEEEESKRKLIFEATVQKMIEHNEKHDKMLVRHRHGLNQFSDLTTEEFLNRNHGNSRLKYNVKKVDIA